MGHDKAAQSDPMPDHTALLESARQHTLRTIAAQDLRTLILRLEEACERSRMAAIRALHDRAPWSSGDEETGRNFGFAGLFSALRRARAEMAARELGQIRM